MKRLVETAQLTWIDGAHDTAAPRSILFDDIYFSDHGIDESRFVFLQGNRLAARFALHQQTTIGELGFGSGLNFLNTWKLWAETNKPDHARLNFLSFEKYPLSRDDFARAVTAWPDLQPYTEQLLGLWPAPIAGFHQIALACDITLTLFLGDVNDGLAQCLPLARGIDAWFLDGFAPAKNAQMWSPALFEAMAALSKPNARLATFSVAGDVRRGLGAAGFEVERVPGFGRKRHMLIGSYTDAKINTANAGPVSGDQAWCSTQTLRPHLPGAAIAVIGGGIAGASIAFALRHQGFLPTIIEPIGLASGASGNRAGLIMPRLDRDDTPTARFFVHAWLYTLRLIQSLAPRYPTLFNANGVAKLAVDDDEIAALHQLLEAELLPDRWIDKINRGVVFAQAGIVDPVLFVKALVTDTLVINRRVRTILYADGKIMLADDNDSIGKFDGVVIANGLAARRFLSGRGLPLTGSIGQLDVYTNDFVGKPARTYGPYICPLPNGKGMVLGATYQHYVDDEPVAPTIARSMENLERFGRYEPETADALDPNNATGRASVRCVTPDRLPIAGPMPDWRCYGEFYDDFRYGRRQTRDGSYRDAVYQPGIYILTGLGSRGLVTAPFCAAMIAAQMAGAPAPTDFDIHTLLHPGRFFIRTLKRARNVKAKA